MYKRQVKKGLYRAGGVFVTATQRVRVGLQRDGGVAVAQACGHGHGVDVVCQQDRGVCVPQVVKAHAFKTVSIGEAAKPFTRRVVVQLRAVPCVDDPTFPHPHVAGPCLSVGLLYTSRCV